MFNAKQFRSLIVKPVLQILGYWSQDSENLLVMICAWESKGGTYLKQEKGPALGVYMMEPETHDNIWKNFLSKEGRWQDVEVFRYHDEAHDMVSNLDYATAMARIFFLLIKEPIPLGLHELAAYAKKYWNTEKGKATADDYYQAYCHFEGIKP